MNHFGRSSYHDANGPLIAMIRKATTLARPLGPEHDDEKTISSLRTAILDICREGKRVFNKDGALHEMVSSLHELVREKKTSDALVAGMRHNQDFWHALLFFSGDAKERDDDDDDDDFGKPNEEL